MVKINATEITNGIKNEKNPTMSSRTYDGQSNCLTFNFCFLKKNFKKFKKILFQIFLITKFVLSIWIPDNLWIICVSIENLKALKTL